MRLWIFTNLFEVTAIRSTGAVWRDSGGEGTTRSGRPWAIITPTKIHKKSGV